MDNSVASLMAIIFLKLKGHFRLNVKKVIAYVFWLYFLLVPSVFAKPDTACELIKDVKIKPASELIKNKMFETSLFKTCEKNGITPAHFILVNYPRSELVPMVLKQYSERSDVDANLRGAFSESETIFSNSVQEKFTLFQAHLIGSPKLNLDWFSTKAGFNPNIKGGIITSSGESPETPLATFYYLTLGFKNRKLRRLDKEENELRKIGATFSNCLVLADLVDTDPLGSNLRKGPGANFPILKKIVRSEKSKAPPALVLTGYNLSGWFQVSHINRNGFENYDERFGQCAEWDKPESEAWVHSSLIDFRYLKQKRSPNESVSRSLCFGELAVQYDKSGKFKVDDSSAELSNKMHSLNSNNQCPSSESASPKNGES